MKDLPNIYTSNLLSATAHRLLRLAVMSFISLLGIVETKGAEVSQDSVEVHFQVSRAELDPSFKRNAERLDSLFSAMRGNGDALLDHVSVSGSASPEGSWTFNKSLSELRAKSIFNYVSRYFSLPDSITEFQFLGRDWPGLYKLVEKDPKVPDRTKVLSLLEESLTGMKTLGEEESDHLLTSLKSLNGGSSYRYMLNHLFPQLRNSKLTLKYTRFPAKVEVMPPIEETLVNTNEPADSIIEERLTSVGEEEIFILEEYPLPKPFYMGVRTNMLLDAALVPNIGVEFYLGKNFTIYGDWMHAWWSKDSSHRYYRIYGGDIGARWWFGSKAHEKPMTGHHVGIYAGAFTFDFEFGGKGYMGGKPGKTILERCFINAGVEYGYSLPVARRLNIDFTVGIGYMTGKYIEYEPGNKPHIYYWDSTRRFRWFGPTKAEISLVWLIGRGNVNTR